MVFEVIRVISRTIFLGWVGGMCHELPDGWLSELPYEPVGKIRKHTVHDGISYCNVSYEAQGLPEWLLGYDGIEANREMDKFDAMRIGFNYNTVLQRRWTD